MVFFSMTMFVQSLTHAYIGHLFSVSNTILGIGKAEKVECGPCLAVHRWDWEWTGTSIAVMWFLLGEIRMCWCRSTQSAWGAEGARQLPERGGAGLSSWRLNRSLLGGKRYGKGWAFYGKRMLPEQAGAHKHSVCVHWPKSPWTRRKLTQWRHCLKCQFPPICFSPFFSNSSSDFFQDSQCLNAPALSGYGTEAVFLWVLINHLSTSLLFQETEKCLPCARKCGTCFTTTISYSDWARWSPFSQWRWASWGQGLNRLAQGHTRGKCWWWF